MADPLTKLSSKYKCDKSQKKQNYTGKYHARLKDMRPFEFNMLEFGFGKGKSAQMWLEYFPKANVVSVDIRDPKEYQKFQNNRFEYIQADQTDKNKVADIITKYRNFYLVIDDASHVPEDQQFTLGYMFPFVEPGGWYVIEDLLCPRSHSKTLPKSRRTIPVLKEFINTDGLFNSPTIDKNQKMYLRDHIDYIKLYEKIAFIKKRGV